ncbi:MAG: hypothetical protein CL872_01535 [Dehalococcoidaceae bacterium]|nr:hypothetical protein [Dehalococcoidaceae bacterium]|tara:strand:+ start:193 stop:393 length:201 start_codon:yes stop_codon:yes gene_type:complete
MNKGIKTFAGFVSTVVGTLVVAGYAAFPRVTKPLMDAGSCLIIASRSVIDKPKLGYKLYFVELTIK